MKAFPSKKMVDGPNDMLVVHDEEGMDLRDYFAAAALTGLMACGDGTAVSDRTLAQWCYEKADAMMKERNRDQRQNQD